MDPSDLELFRQARFLTSAPDLARSPPDTGAEVAFAGRSNAGKSSAINALTNQRKLARTSKTPGRTRLINFFDLGGNRRLVDLPGYGYARVAQSVKQEWQRNLAHYLEARQSLVGLVLLMDIRHPLQDSDRFLIGWAAAAELPVHAVLTKADKLRRGPALSVLHQLRKDLASHPLATGQYLSSLRGTGIDELATVLSGWLGPGEAADEEAP